MGQVKQYYPIIYSSKLRILITTEPNEFFILGRLYIGLVKVFIFLFKTFFRGFSIIRASTCKGRSIKETPSIMIIILKI